MDSGRLSRQTSTGVSRKRLRRFAGFLFAFTGAGVFGQAGTPATTTINANSCRNFVQEFYDWYVPIANASDKRFTVSLKPRQHSFDPELWRMLAADDEAQSHAHEIVGLDFDPILNSQDPSPKFKVRSVAIKGSRCNVAVVGVNEGVEDEHVMSELVFSNGHWAFVNFHYQSWVAGKLRSSGDLMQALKDWARDRVRFTKENSK